MVLSYKELKEKLPKDTLKIIDDVLPYLSYYADHDKNYRMHFTDDTYAGGLTSTVLCLLLNFACNNKEIEAFLASHGFNNHMIDIYSTLEDYVDRNQLTEAGKAAAFTKFSYLLPIFKDSIEYETYYPTDLLLDWLKKYNKECTKFVYDKLFTASFGSLSKNLELVGNERREKESHELEISTYENLPISVINYLEIASKIRSLLINSSFDYKSLKTGNENDLTALSLFMALYCYEDLENGKDGISLSQTIVDTLTSLGVNKSGLRVSNSYDLSKVERNVNAINRCFKRYYKNGCNEGKDTSQISVLDIMNNLFDRNFTNSFIIEKLLAAHGVDINNLKDFKGIVERSIEEKKKEKESKKIETFYSRTNKYTRTFLENSSRVYTLVLKKMKEGKHNSKVLTDEDDADTLSLLISSYLFNTDVAKFYQNHGITLEEIMKYVGIELKPSEIEREELDEKVLINRFQRFLEDGVNKNKEAKKVTINEISYNLCDREFNKTTIMEDIFNTLSNSSALDANFLVQLKDELERKEKIRRLSIAQELFKHSSMETIKFFEQVSKYHQICSANLSTNYTEDDIKTISILFAILSREDSISEVFSDLGITRENLRSALKINSLNIDKLNSDIDIIASEYVPYIIRTQKIDDIGQASVYNIAKNLFKKENSNSISIKRLLNTFGLTYDTFEDFDKEHEALNYKSKLLCHGVLMNNEIINAITLCEYFAQKRANNKLDIPGIKTDDDIATLSLLIAMGHDLSSGYYPYEERNDRCIVDKILNKYGLTQEFLLKWAQLSQSDIENISNRRINYTLGNRFVSKFIPTKPLVLTSEVFRALFDKDINESDLIQELITDEKRYKMLKYEIETKKDYESSLTIEDRISELTEQGIDYIDIEDIDSILNFGNSLKNHSKYIYDELPKLALSDSNEKSIETIKSLTTKVYNPEEQKRRNIFTRLFTLDKREMSPRIVVNKDALTELKDVINKHVIQLSGEVHGYDAIRRYLEAYRAKNREYLQIVRDLRDKVEKELSGLDPKKPSQYARFLQLSSIKQILNDKVNRFETTVKIAEQDLIRINQSIVTHFITINSLDMAKTDLFPLIGAELAIAQGRMTEKGALEISKNAIGLFTALLEGNTSQTMESMRLLQGTSIPQDVLDTISRDIEVHIEGIKQREQLEALEVVEERPLLTSGDTEKKAKRRKK